MRFEVSGIDHNGLLLAAIGRQSHHHLCEDDLIAPALPTVIERLVQAIFLGRIAPL